MSVFVQFISPIQRATMHDITVQVSI